MQSHLDSTGTVHLGTGSTFGNNQNATSLTGGSDDGALTNTDVMLYILTLVLCLGTIALSVYLASKRSTRSEYDPIADPDNNRPSGNNDGENEQRAVIFANPEVVPSVGTRNPSSVPPPNPYSTHEEEDPNNIEDGDDDDNDDDNDDDDDHEIAPVSNANTKSDKLKQYNLLTFDKPAVQEVKISIKEERKQSVVSLSMTTVD